MRTRSWRRDKTKKAQSRRLRVIKATCWSNINKSQHIGKLKKSNFSLRRKAHKWGYAPALKISDRRKIQKE